LQTHESKDQLGCAGYYRLFGLCHTLCVTALIPEQLGFEYLMIGIAFAVGSYSLYHGHKKHHHSWLPLLLFSTGILCLLAKMQWHEWRNWFLLPAVICIVTAHFINFRLCREHDHAHADDCNH
jgi:hypothetical protein